jgi:L-ascorbate metabolism protein UlaG (beta-lactamase superfamily)
MELPVKQVDLSHFNNQNNDQLNVTWLGHSSLMINIDGYKLLTDPVFEKRISVFGPTRFNGDVPLDIQQIPTIDAVIISHDHYDHLNKHSVQGLIEKSNRFIVPLAVGARLIDWGVPRDKIVELDWWQEYRLDQKLMVAATPAQHFSGRGITDRNKTLWSSWVIKTPFHKLFFSGDSGYFDGFKQIGDKYGPFDMTFIECGAYGEGWPKVHMFPEQTVQAHLNLKGTVLHPIHWATFNLALHPWYEPMVRLTAAADSKNIETATPIVGETTVYGTSIAAKRWWEQPMQMSGVVIKTASLNRPTTEIINHE